VNFDFFILFPPFPSPTLNWNFPAQRGPKNGRQVNLVRGLIERVTIVPDGSAPDGIWLEIEGDLAQLLSFSVSGQAKAPRLGAMGAVQLSVDAGTGSHRQLLVAGRA
jgi:hypothetical protein